MEAVLLIEDLRDGHREARLLPVGRPVLVGRIGDADVRLAHESVSALHARLVFDGRTLWAEDLDAQTGSWLGQRRLAPGQPEGMREGEALQLGDFRLLLTTSPADRQHALTLGTSHLAAPSLDADLNNLSSLAAEALRQRSQGGQFVPAAPAAAAMHPAVAPPRASEPAFAPPAFAPLAFAPPAFAPPAFAPPAFAPPAFAPPAASPVSAPPVVVSPAGAPPLGAFGPVRQTIGFDPTVVAKLAAAGLPSANLNTRPSGHTSIIAATRPDPGAGSLTFSGIAGDSRELIAPNVLASASRGRPVEHDPRGDAGRERASGSVRNAGSSRSSSSSPSSRRSSASSARGGATQPRRKVVRQKRSVWPFLLLGAMVLGMGGLAANLFLRGSLPWAKPADRLVEPVVAEPAAAAESPSAPPAESKTPKPGNVRPPNPPPQVSPPEAASTHSKTGKHHRRQASRAVREHAHGGADARTPGAV